MSRIQASEIHGTQRRAGKARRPMMTAADAKDSRVWQDVQKRMGIGFANEYAMQSYAKVYGAMDSAFNPSITQASVGTPVQFLQYFMPGVVNSFTAARKSDELFDQVTVGDFADMEIVQAFQELAGTPALYGDSQNIPLASANWNFERRSIQRFELGFEVSILQEEQLAKMRVNANGVLRNAVTRAFEILRNKVNFYGVGVNATAGVASGLTFGFLNDPNLPDPVQVVQGAGAGSPRDWNHKTVPEIENDITIAIQQLVNQTLANIDPNTTKMILAIPHTVIGRLSIPNDFGISVMGWLKDTYPNIEVVTVPELAFTNAGGSASQMFYLYAEDVNLQDDYSTDDGKSIVGMTPQRFRALGVERRAKGYIEDFASAYAGVLVKRPLYFARYFGI